MFLKLKLVPQQQGSMRSQAYLVPCTVYSTTISGKITYHEFRQTGFHCPPSLAARYPCGGLMGEPSLRSQTAFPLKRLRQWRSSSRWRQSATLSQTWKEKGKGVGSMSRFFFKKMREIMLEMREKRRQPKMSTLLWYVWTVQGGFTF